MDHQNAGYLNVYGPPSASAQFPYSPRGNFAPVSPYLNFDPAYLAQSGPEWIFPEGASRQRGRFELAFSQIGGSVMTGALLGGFNGFYTGLKETAAAGHVGSVRRTQMLNYITKRGAGIGNTLGVIAVMYSSFGVIFSLVRGVDDELNTVSAATAAGLLYKSSAGLRRCAVGGALGFSLATAYCLWTGRDRLQQMFSPSPA
ncbi:mitochondrial import inner membrane translocase subunit Tim23-like [Limulus polyphemus]|uniref:Mitochondrial import inner membrane translocase subunit Tim23-like n=1 Tax=Limulus polyphemus TaxID=6850 RepID=A0ABM1B7T0_LIMPO|nr:mitochondrial import inner membrane translocase subunit Tim23-like [Limulus polyphemus]